MCAQTRLAPHAGIAAMQSINITVLNPWFLGVAALAIALTQWPSTRAVLLIAGGALYLLGTFQVTVVFNLPRNRVLASVAAEAPDAAAVWTRYLSSWTAWNHVRAAAALAAAAAFVMTLRV